MIANKESEKITITAQVAGAENLAKQLKSDADFDKQKMLDAIGSGRADALRKHDRVLEAYHRHVDVFGDKREWKICSGFKMINFADREATKRGIEVGITSVADSSSRLPFPTTPEGRAARDAFAAEVGLEAIADFIRDNP